MRDRCIEALNFKPQTSNFEQLFTSKQSFKKTFLLFLLTKSAFAFFLPLAEYFFEEVGVGLVEVAREFAFKRGGQRREAASADVGQFLVCIHAF